MFKQNDWFLIDAGWRQHHSDWLQFSKAHIVLWGAEGSNMKPTVCTKLFLLFRRSQAASGWCLSLALSCKFFARRGFQSHVLWLAQYRSSITLNKIYLSSLSYMSALNMFVSFLFTVSSYLYIFNEGRVGNCQNLPVQQERRRNWHASEPPKNIKQAYPAWNLKKCLFKKCLPLDLWRII